MKIFVKVKTNAKEERVEQVDDKHYLVSVKESPVDDRANEALVKLLARYFKVAPSGIRIVFGRTARQKIVDVSPLDNLGYS